MFKISSEPQPQKMRPAFSIFGLKQVEGRGEDILPGGRAYSWMNFVALGVPVHVHIDRICG